VPSDDDDHHADREDQDVGVLHDDVRDVLRRQEDAVGQEVEQDDDGDERQVDTALAKVFGEE
jgi:hypothetical protein